MAAPLQPRWLQPVITARAGEGQAEHRHGAQGLDHPLRRRFSYAGSGDVAAGGLADPTIASAPRCDRASAVAQTPARDDKQEHGQRRSPRSLTPVIAVVDADPGRRARASSRSARSGARGGDAHIAGEEQPSRFAAHLSAAAQFGPLHVHCASSSAAVAALVVACGPGRCDGTSWASAATLGRTTGDSVPSGRCVTMSGPSELATAMASDRRPVDLERPDDDGGPAIAARGSGGGGRTARSAAPLPVADQPMPEDPAVGDVLVLRVLGLPAATRRRCGWVAGSSRRSPAIAVRPGRVGDAKGIGQRRSVGT